MLFCAGSKLDLRSLLEDLKEVTNWFQLGLWLGIKHADLEIIERNHEHDNERCKEEMLAFWLKNFSNASRRKLVSALKEINYRNLAKQLQEKYNVPPTGIQILYLRLPASIPTSCTSLVSRPWHSQLNFQC